MCITLYLEEFSVLLYPYVQTYQANLEELARHTCLIGILCDEMTGKLVFSVVHNDILQLHVRIPRSSLQLYLVV